MSKALSEYLKYDPSTGSLIWIKRPSPSILPGTVAGTIDWNGYRRIKCRDINTKAHRVVWFIHKGEWPKQLDHINGKKDDNRIENLREITTRGNNINRDIHRNGRLPGAIFEKSSGRYKCGIRINGRWTHLGRFDTAEEAHACYMRKFKELENVEEKN